jgi:hypothetical protein
MSRPAAGGIVDRMSDRPILRMWRWNDTYASHVQWLLTELGYYGGLIDGDYGPLSKAAVTEFQRDRALSLIDGVVGDETWRALDQAELELGIRIVEETPNLTWLAFPAGSHPRVDPVDNPTSVVYTVVNQGDDTIAGWRDRITLSIADGDVLFDEVVGPSDHVAPGGTFEWGVWLTGVPSPLPDGVYELAVQTNIDGHGDTDTSRFIVENGQVDLRAYEPR